MAETRAHRTLVKSPPELWAEISDVGALARHLGEFGEIRITRLEPETAVAWEGDRARGTVELEPSGWGTRVTLTAEMADGGEAADRAEADTPPAAEASPPEAEAEALEAEVDAAEAEVGAAAEVEAAAAAAEAEHAPLELRVGFFARLFGGRRWRRPAEAPVLELVAAKEQAAMEEESAVVEEPAPAAVTGEEEEQPAVVEEPAVVEQPAVAPASPPALDLGRAEAILTEVLDDLGTAHHRPFSRLS